MPFALSVAQIEALAPDSASVTAGRKLAKPGPWKGLGQNDVALWGECEGSATYQTQIALSDFGSKCSCPSRKFPCKHALGLMLLASAAPGAMPTGTAPSWVSDWLEKRSAAHEKKAARADAAASKPVDELGQAKRFAKRHEAILAGMDQLDGWMADVLRQGLARVRSESPSFWDVAARRLVDAQAPALATRLRRMGERVGVGEDWASRLLDELGGLALSTQAYRRLGDLEPGLAADVRRLVGLTMDQVDVVAHGDLVDDEWSVLCEVHEEDERVRARRTWLRGTQSGRTALIAQFAVGTAAFAEVLIVGTRFRARLAFWPSAAPRRALVVERLGEATTITAPPRGESIVASLDRHASLVGRSPWVESELFVLDGAVPVPLGDAALSFDVVDGEGGALPLRGSGHDVLLAISGGHPVTLLGEWDGYGLAPLFAWSRSRLVPLPTRHP